MHVDPGAPGGRDKASFQADMGGASTPSAFLLSWHCEEKDTYMCFADAGANNTVESRLTGSAMLKMSQGLLTLSIWLSEGVFTQKES